MNGQTLDFTVQSRPCMNTCNISCVKNPHFNTLSQAHSQKYHLRQIATCITQCWNRNHSSYDACSTLYRTFLFFSIHTCMHMYITLLLHCKFNSMELMWTLNTSQFYCKSQNTFKAELSIIKFLTAWTLNKFRRNGNKTSKLWHFYGKFIKSIKNIVSSRKILYKVRKSKYICKTP